MISRAILEKPALVSFSKTSNSRGQYLRSLKNSLVHVQPRRTQGLIPAHRHPRCMLFQIVLERL